MITLADRLLRLPMMQTWAGSTWMIYHSRREINDSAFIEMGRR
jgi:hypothetical protein